MSKRSPMFSRSRPSRSIAFSQQEFEHDLIRKPVPAFRDHAPGNSLMAQLSDDCFAFGGALLPIAEMERLIAERIAPVAEIETVPLAAARGRVIARDIVAPIDLPPFDNSAVDGYAVRHADLAPVGDTRLDVVDRVTAG